MNAVTDALLLLSQLVCHSGKGNCPEKHKHANGLEHPMLPIRGSVWCLIPFACLRLPGCNNLRWETTKRMAMTTDTSHHTRHTLFAKQSLEQSATYFTLHTGTCGWNARCAGELLFGTGDAQCALERETQTWNACVCHNWEFLQRWTYLLVNRNLYQIHHFINVVLSNEFNLLFLVQS